MTPKINWKIAQACGTIQGMMLVCLAAKMDDPWLVGVGASGLFRVPFGDCLKAEAEAILLCGGIWCLAGLFVHARDRWFGPKEKPSKADPDFDLM